MRLQKKNMWTRFLTGDSKKCPKQESKFMLYSEMEEIKEIES